MIAHCNIRKLRPELSESPFEISRGVEAPVGHVPKRQANSHLLTEPHEVGALHPAFEEATALRGHVDHDPPIGRERPIDDFICARKVPEVYGLSVSHTARAACHATGRHRLPRTGPNDR